MATDPTQTHRPVFEPLGEGSDAPAERGSAVTHARSHTQARVDPVSSRSDSSSTVSRTRLIHLGIDPSCALGSDIPMDITAPDPKTPTKGAPLYPRGGSTKVVRTPRGTIASNSLILYVGAVDASYIPRGDTSTAIPSHIFVHSG